jgi:hypothetical protein
MEKSYSLVQNKLSFGLKDNLSNQIHFLLDFETEYSFKGTLEYENTTYNFSTNSWLNKFYLDVGTERIVNAEMNLSGEYIIRILNIDKMTKLFTFESNSLLGAEFVIKDFLGNELFHVKEIHTSSEVQSLIIEGHGWNDEENNVSKIILLMITFYLNVVMKGMQLDPSQILLMI